MDKAALFEDVINNEPGWTDDVREDMGELCVDDLLRILALKNGTPEGGE